MFSRQDIINQGKIILFFLKLYWKLEGVSSANFHFYVTISYKNYKINFLTVSL